MNEKKHPAGVFFVEILLDGDVDVVSVGRGRGNRTVAVAEQNFNRFLLHFNGVFNQRHLHLLNRQCVRTQST